MKGIITFYDEDKGFGFLKDINEEKRFFHISGLREKNKFISNLKDYYFTDCEDRKCLVVDFNPSENSKGLNAVDIVLTNQVFNDKISKGSYEVLITDFKYNSETLTRIVSGIKNGSFVPFGASRGGHGTYRIGYPEAFRELNIHFRRTDDIGWGTIEVRDLVLSLNDRSKITDKLVETLKNNLVGKKVLVTPTSVSWDLNDKSILEI